ncbi:MAG: sulfatase-like hydrolase/transferase [Acidobacteria bacterium]|nr:sulfatase-like hydrolase/transferase [Acidobacteriota bacterium]
MAKSIGLVAARLALAGFTALTAAWCLLAYIPFTYHQVCRGGLLPWFSAFARLHPYLYWPVFAVTALTLGPAHGLRRAGKIAFVVFYAAAGIGLMAHPLLMDLGNDTQSLLWCCFALLPLLWVGLLDLAPGETRRRAASDPSLDDQQGLDTRRVFRACLAAAIYAWAMSAGISFAQYGGRTGERLKWVAASLASHTALFMAAFLALSFAGAVAALAFRRAAAQAWVYGGAAATLLTLALVRVVFSPLSFAGRGAPALALAASGSMVILLVGMSARMQRSETSYAGNGFDFILFPALVLLPGSRWGQCMALGLASAAPIYALWEFRTADWQHLVSDVAILALWAGAFVFFYAAQQPMAGKPQKSEWRLVSSAGLLCLYGAAMYFERQGRIDGAASYAGLDAGFRLAHSSLSLPAEAAPDASFYSFLAAHTNLPRSAAAAPAQIKLVERLEPGEGAKPNIFIFVIDSLRRDYVAPYNPAVWFTPAISSFAAESAVERNAFTRYTGTGLSEPSIWMGALSPHRQYLMPFTPMNSLERLLQFEHYRQYITRDEVLSLIVPPTSAMTELDAGKPTMNCELCATLGELQEKIANSGDGAPVFAYTQPQNLHVSVIRRQGRRTVDEGGYGGFDAAYASRVRAMDGCFGRFIEFLKRRGMYENSIVILTSDHGESLGEREQWGHAFNVAPEVVRVPLIIHLPAAHRRLANDADAPASLIDIAPTLYYLLGHRPIVHNELFGRPLFTENAAEGASYLRTSYVVASSYGPVYGLLTNGARSLYVADAMAYRDDVFGWEDGRVTQSELGVAPRLDLREKIRDELLAVDAFYGPGRR